ncbi:helix-turn-helix transcriptional regulator [Enterococcus diestrammenae]|uniref:helix-turn-helix transcriptional regulator n=1 Tax=Enterococcus diestrammenae TaxID=1155073 RepID=UPI0019577ABD
MKINNTNSLNTKEAVQHGTADFKLQLYHNIDHVDNGLIFYSHWHEEAEILYILDGEMEIVVDSISLFVKKGTFVLIPPNLLHGAFQIYGQHCHFSSIVFHSDFIDSKSQDRIQKSQLTPFLDNTFLSSYILSPFDYNSEKMKSIFNDFHSCYCEVHPFRELLLKGYLLQMLFYLLQKEKKYEIKSANIHLQENRKKTILKYIEENYKNQISLQDLSQSVSLSKEQFCRFFKHSFRTSPIQYLNQYRINRACLLLGSTNLSVIDIALEVGFDSSNYFSIAFKKAIGMTPSQFRKTTQK